MSPTTSATPKGKSKSTKRSTSATTAASPGISFADRADAGRRLGGRLQAYRGADAVVLGLPRGGVPVAFEVARALALPLDVILVRKLGAPFEPELAMGAVGEGGARVIDEDLVRRAGIGAEALAGAERRERAELARRAQRFRRGRPRRRLGGRTAIIVDDGIATGASMRVACRVARELGAARVVAAVPVAPPGAAADLAGLADEVVCLATPAAFTGVSAFYRDFAQTRDEEVVALLAQAAAGPDGAPC